VGSVIVTWVVDVQPRLSVTVKVCVQTPLEKVPVPVYGSVPPVADTVTTVVPPLQAIVPAEEDAVSTLGSVIVTWVVDIQPRLSVTVNVCVPTPLEKVPVPVYGRVPPVADTVTTVVPPLHWIVPALDDAVNNVG